MVWPLVLVALRGGGPARPALGRSRSSAASSRSGAAASASLAARAVAPPGRRRPVPGLRRHRRPGRGAAAGLRAAPAWLGRSAPAAAVGRTARGRERRRGVVLGWCPGHRRGGVTGAVPQRRARDRVDRLGRGGRPVERRASRATARCWAARSSADRGPLPGAPARMRSTCGPGPSRSSCRSGGPDLAKAVGGGGHRGSWPGPVRDQLPRRRGSIRHRTGWAAPGPVSGGRCGGRDRRRRGDPGGGPRAGRLPPSTSASTPRPPPPTPCHAATTQPPPARAARAARLKVMVTGDSVAWTIGLLPPARASCRPGIASIDSRASSGAAC